MKNKLITVTSPQLSVSEIFKTLTTNMEFINASNKFKSILVTSTVSGEGKSWVSANLAISFAKAGKKVILVDTDMRKGEQHNMFEVSNNNGLSNYLISALEKKKIHIDDYIKRTMIENLYVITAGVVSPNPTELLTTSKMSDLIKALEKHADIIIYDSLARNVCEDSIILAKNIKCTLIISSHKQTRIRSLKHLKKEIENVGGKIAGVVVNKLPRLQKGYDDSSCNKELYLNNKNKKGDDKWIFAEYSKQHNLEIEDIESKSSIEENLKEEPGLEIKYEKENEQEKEKEDNKKIKKENVNTQSKKRETSKKVAKEDSEEINDTKTEAKSKTRSKTKKESKEQPKEENEQLELSNIYNETITNLEDLNVGIKSKSDNKTKKTTKKGSVKKEPKKDTENKLVEIEGSKVVKEEKTENKTNKESEKKDTNKNKKTTKSKEK